jgi:ABC-type uncharacterized transport system permease subunit
MPVAAVCALLPAFFPDRHLLGNAGQPAVPHPLRDGDAAYSLFTLAALHAMLMAVAERSLHGGRLTRARQHAAAACTMEGLLFRLITVAFVLLTRTLAQRHRCFPSSPVRQAFRFNHKTVFAILSWIVFGTLLVGRHTSADGAGDWPCAGRWADFSFCFLPTSAHASWLEVVLGRT